VAVAGAPDTSYSGRVRNERLKVLMSFQEIVEEVPEFSDGPIVGFSILAADQTMQGSLHRHNALPEFIRSPRAAKTPFLFR
jgi:hypothetical protein